MADWGKDRMIYRMISRILGISGKYKNRIRVAFVFFYTECALIKNANFLFDDCNMENIRTVNAKRNRLVY